MLLVLGVPGGVGDLGEDVGDVELCVGVASAGPVAISVASGF